MGQHGLCIGKSDALLNTESGLTLFVIFLWKHTISYVQCSSLFDRPINMFSCVSEGSVLPSHIVLLLVSDLHL